MAVDNPLSRPVECFVRSFAPVLVDLVVGLPLAKADKFPEDFALEAFYLAAVFIYVVGRHTDDELDAFIASL